ncbi:MAG: hypothetical protein HUU20_25945 [Pirellulales bacterium]|nr:hypothetical protein [Pirellulales bacterium]
MQAESYTLEFRGVSLGIVTRKDSDFPNLWGSFTPLLADDHPEIRDRIEHYRQYSVDADRLMETAFSQWEASVNENDSEFLDLMECDDWFLVDPSGNKHGILIPIFTQEGLVWRWNPGL